MLCKLHIRICFFSHNFLTLSLIGYTPHNSFSIIWPILTLSVQLSLSYYIQWRLSAQLSLHYHTHSSPFTSIKMHMYIYILLLTTSYKWKITIHILKINQKYTKSILNHHSQNPHISFIMHMNFIITIQYPFS